MPLNGRSSERFYGGSRKTHRSKHPPKPHRLNPDCPFHSIAVFPSSWPSLRELFQVLRNSQPQTQTHSACSSKMTMPSYSPGMLPMPWLPAPYFSSSDRSKTFSPPDHPLLSRRSSDDDHERKACLCNSGAIHLLRNCDTLPRPIRCNPFRQNESRLWRSASSSGATDGSSRSRTHSARSLICIAHASAMLIPLIFEDRAASLSRSEERRVG